MGNSSWRGRRNGGADNSARSVINEDEGEYVTAEDAGEEQLRSLPSPSKDDGFFFDAQTNFKEDDTHKGFTDNPDDGGEEFLPSSSSPSRDNGFLFDVFLSFRGEDTRKGFIGHLYQALMDKGVRTFVDSEDLEKGEKVEELFYYVEKSNIFLPVFSQGYADSKWCLKEIAKIVKCKRVIIPVFFDLQPAEVRHQRGPFESAFKRYSEAKNFDEKEVSEWRDALREAGEVSGFNLSDTDGHEAKLVQIIAKRVLKELNRSRFDLPEVRIGLDDPMQDIVALLDLQANDVKMVGIHGMGGIGKTTLAKAIYNAISSKFQAASFLSSIKEKGIITLQKQLLSDIFCYKDAQINDVDEGTKLIKQRVRSKIVLVVLDDIDDVKQLPALACCRDRLSKGSRIIVTTRDRHVLNVSGVEEHEIYELKTLNPVQSLQLFSYHAFGRKEPLQGFAGLSQQVVSIASGLPLALEVYGSMFFDMKTPTKWISMLGKLEDCQDKKIHERLKVSFDGLDEGEKEILLDIACFFIGHEKEDLEYMWRDCGFYPDISLDVLLHRSLIKLNERHQFEMHDQIRDMGKQIVINECLKLPSKRSRLWKIEDVIEALEYPEGRSKSEGIVLCRNRYDSAMCLFTESFANMSRLRLFDASYTTLEGEYKYLPKKLKWLKLEGCLLDSLPFDFHLANVVVLDLSFSKITRLWGQQPVGTKALVKLKVLYLSGCTNLVASPDFSCIPSVEKLKFDGCVKMSEIHESIGQLVRLVYLSMKSCYSVKELPDSLCELNSLQHLVLDDCSSMSTFPRQLGNLKSLKHLDMSATGLTSLPDISNMENLFSLHLPACRSLKMLPEYIGKVKTLIHLDIQMTDIKRLPESIGYLVNLEELSLSWCPLEGMPSSIGNLKNLKLLNLEGTAIQELPNSFGNLSNLRELNLSDTKIQELPDSVGSLEKLEKLLLVRCGNLKFLPRFVMWTNLQQLKLSALCCTSLPENIGILTNMRELETNHNPDLVSVPSSFWHLISLERLQANGCNYWSDMHYLGRLSSLKELDLSNSMELQSLPSSLESLSRLEKLSVDGCQSLEYLPRFPPSIIEVSALDCPALMIISGISKCKNLRALGEELVDMPAIENLNRLQRLYISKCRRLESFLHLPESLMDLCAWHCNSLVMMPDVSNLKSLENLDLSGCKMLVDVPGLQNLNCLRRLCLDGCDGLQSLPQLPSTLESLRVTYYPPSGTISYVSNLKCLRTLNLSECKMQKLSGLENLKRLFDLCVSGCGRLSYIGHLPPSLTFLDASGCSSLEILSDVLNLKSLMYLFLTGCVKLVNIEGLENLNCIKELKLKECWSLSDDLRNRIIKEANFENLSSFSIPGSLCSRETGTALSFIHPNWFGERYLCLKIITEGFEDEWEEVQVRSQVVINGHLIFEDMRKLITMKDGLLTYCIESQRHKQNALVQVSFGHNFQLQGDLHFCGQRTEISINIIARN